MSVARHEGIVTEGRSLPAAGYIYDVVEFYCWTCELRILGASHAEVKRLAQSHVHHAIEAAESKRASNISQEGQS